VSEDPDLLRKATSWDAVLDESSYYELLGVLDIADASAIKAAFHQFALAFHPDSHVGASEQLLARVRRVFKRGAEAYRVLSDPGLRAKYDMALAQGHLRLEAGEIPKGVEPFAGGLKSLEDLCKTAAGKRHARRSDEYISAGDMRSAQRELKLAVHQEGQGHDPELLERLDALDLALFAMGD
jgi:DnaJ-class molecular chaperone